MRLRDRLLILLANVGGELLGRSGDHHLTTDPACVRYRAPRPGSRLDRASRGHSCGRCMADAAFGREALLSGTPWAKAPDQTARLLEWAHWPLPKTPDHENRSR